MPVSKKRKLHGKNVVRQPVQMPVRDTSKQWSLKIKPSQLIYLKDDEDFLTIVEFGRWAFGGRVLIFAFQDRVEFCSFEDSHGVEEFFAHVFRHWVQNLFGELGHRGCWRVSCDVNTANGAETHLT